MTEGELIGQNKPTALGMFPKPRNLRFNCVMHTFGGSALCPDAHIAQNISPELVQYFSSYLVQRQTDKQTNTRQQKHNLLGEGKYTEHALPCSITVSHEVLLWEDHNRTRVHW